MNFFGSVQHPRSDLASLPADGFCGRGFQRHMAGDSAQPSKAFTSNPTRSTSSGRLCAAGRLFFRGYRADYDANVTRTSVTGVGRQGVTQRLAR